MWTRPAAFLPPALGSCETAGKNRHIPLAKAAHTRRPLGHPRRLLLHAMHGGGGGGLCHRCRGAAGPDCLGLGQQFFLAPAEWWAAEIRTTRRESLLRVVKWCREGEGEVPDDEESETELVTSQWLAGPARERPRPALGGLPVTTTTTTTTTIFC